MSSAEAVKNKNAEHGFHNSCILCSGSQLEALDGYEEAYLTQCSHCDLVFCRRIPTEAELVAHYAKYERNASVDSQVSQQGREGILDEFERYRRENRILDVGCGVGLLLNQARARGWETYGTEFSDDAIALCESNGHRMERSPLDAEDFEPGTFDVVVYTEVIEHIQNQLEEFEEVLKLLRPGGVVYVTTPNFDCLERRLLGTNWNVIEYPEHLTYFTPKTIRHLFERKGFRIERIRTTGISLTRLIRSWKAGGTSQGSSSSALEESHVLDDNPCKDDSSADQIVRRLLAQSPALSNAKHLINQLLNATRLGNSLKLWARKPDSD